jgi:hypothetical protein
MKKIAIAAAAALLLGVSGSATAWWGGPMGSDWGPMSGDGWGDMDFSMRSSGSGWGRGRGHGYGYPSYGYAPYGYGYPYGAPYGAAAPYGAPYALPTAPRPPTELRPPMAPRTACLLPLPRPLLLHPQRPSKSGNFGSCAHREVRRSPASRPFT